MNPNLSLPLARCVFAIILASLFSVRAHADYSVINDPISYASWSGDQPRMSEVWAQNSGNAPVVVAEPAPSTNHYFTIVNGVIKRPLGVTLTEEFDLSFDVLQGDYARVVWAGLFNAAGTQGYGFAWDSGALGGQGTVSIRRFSVASPDSLAFNTLGTNISGGAASGRSPVTAPFAHIRLTWKQATSTLTLYVDGVQKLTCVDSSFGSFSRIFVSGNGTAAKPAQFDNIAISTNDTQAPSVALTAPADGASLAGLATITATASDNLGLAGVQFKLDGENLGAEMTQAPYALEWDTDETLPGPHTLTAVARDLVGNITTSAPVAVTTAGYILTDVGIDAYVRDGNYKTRNYGSSLTLEAGKGSTSDTDQREIALKFSTAEILNVGRAFLRLYGEQKEGTPVLEARSSSNIDWDEPGLRWVNRPVLEPAVLATAAIEPGLAWYEWDVTPALQAAKNAHLGAVTLVVRRAGNSVGVASFRSGENAENAPYLFVIPDRTLPTVGITKPLDGTTVARRVAITANAADNRAVAAVQFLLDGVAMGAEQTVAPYGLIWDTETAATGQHVITATVRDAAGNLVTSSAVHVEVVRSLPPSAVAQFEAETFDAMSGVSGGLTSISDFNSGDWVRFKAVDFDQGFITLQARVASANVAADYGELELHLDAPDGEKVAALRVLNTGEDTTWDVQTTAISGASGTHDLYVVANGSNGHNVCALDWIKLRHDIVPRGATVPFVTYEAEAGTYTGTLNGSSDQFHRYGASQRGYVWLANPGEYVQWTAQLPANQLTLRYGIPLGSNGTITVSVNGTPQTVNLTAAQCYDAASITTKPRRYNEVSIPITIAKDDVVRVEKGNLDTLAWYAIDLIDLEEAAPAATMPDGFISITSYGATANDTTDDYAAIMACISAASSTGKKVFFPAGTFRTQTRINLPADYEVRGAGLFYTTLYCPKLGDNYTDFVGFGVSSNCRISDLTVEAAATERGNGPMGTRSLSSASGFTLENMRFLNTGDVIGWTVYSNATFRNLRAIGTYADGVHLGDSAVQNCLVENCFFRGSGDDAIAQVNSANLLLCSGNVAQFNTIMASYSGRGIANIGGDTLIVRDCIINGVFNAGLMIATEPLPPSISRPIQQFKVQRTTVELCGHPASVYPGGSNHAGVHFWLFTTLIRDVKIEDCAILNGDTKAIRIDDTNFGDELGRTQFNYNVAAGNATGGLDDASPEVQPVFTGNTGF